MDCPYELLVRLAAGGMGAVFIGVPRGADAPLVAVKRAHAHLAEDPDFRKMFVAEARLAASIRSPHAIGVSEVLESDGELLMVMPYVEGGSLSDLLVASGERGRRIPPPVTLRILLDAAHGLDGAHLTADAEGRPLGIVHRDVSPHNILVSVDGTASIVDFGVAKAAQIEATRTATDVLKGKTAYMAPEYVKSKIANPQTDVFGLAIVAWEALANRRLFKGTDELETINRLLDPTPPPLLHELVSIDATVAAVVARALAKNPAQRHLTASDFALALERAASAADVLARRNEVGATVRTLLGRDLDERRLLLRESMASRPGQLASIRGAAQTASPGSLPPSSSAPTMVRPISVARPAATMPSSAVGHTAEPRPATRLPTTSAGFAGAPSSVDGPKAFPATHVMPSAVAARSLPGAAPPTGPIAGAQSRSGPRSLPVVAALGGILVVGIVAAASALSSRLPAMAPEPDTPGSAPADEPNDAEVSRPTPAPQPGSPAPSATVAAAPAEPEPSASASGRSGTQPPSPAANPLGAPLGGDRSTSPGPLPKAPAPPPSEDPGYRPKANPY